MRAQRAATTLEGAALAKRRRRTPRARASLGPPRSETHVAAGRPRPLEARGADQPAQCVLDDPLFKVAHDNRET